MEDGDDDRRLPWSGWKGQRRGMPFEDEDRRRGALKSWKKIYELPSGQGLFAAMTELIWGSVALATTGLIHVIPKVNL